MVATDFKIRHTGLFVGNRWYDGETTFTDVNPTAEAPLAEVTAGSADDVDRAVLSARQALDGEWARSPGRAGPRCSTG